MLQLLPRFQNSRMHLLDRNAQLAPETTQNLLLPRVVLGVHARLHLLIVHHCRSEPLLRRGGVERRSCLLDLRQELLPVAQSIPQPRKHMLGLEVPERLEAEPFGDVLSQLMYLAFDQREGSCQRFIAKAS